jgi:hypothetical protein
MMYDNTMRGMCGCPRCLDDILKEVFGKLAAAKLTGDAPTARIYKRVFRHYAALRRSLEPFSVPRRRKAGVV